MEKLITNKKLKADFVQYTDALLRDKPLAVCRIALGMLFCRLATKEGWDFDTEIQPVCHAAFESDRGATGDAVGAGTLQYLLRYCEGRAA